MFRTDIRAMDQATMEMQWQLRKLNQAIDETESVITGLGNLSGMDSVKYSLRKEIDRMEAEKRSLRDMLSALNQIENCYRVCENNILNYAEGNIRRSKAGFEWFSVEFNKNMARLVGTIVY